MRSLTISLLLVVMVSLFAIGWALDALFERYSNNARDDTSVVVSIGRSMADSLNRMEDPSAFVEQWSESEFASVSLTDFKDYPLPNALREQLLTGEALLLESDRGISANFYLPGHDVVFALEGIDTDAGNRIWMKTFFTSLFYLGTLAVVLLWLRPLLLRLRSLKSAALVFGEGDLNSRVNTSGISYIADIENQYNRMAGQIQTLVEDNKLLTASVSHDLRTPLARLRFGIDTLSVTEDPVQRWTYEKRISEDLDEMESLVDSLLQFARLDNVMGGVEKAKLSLPVLIEECMSQYLDQPITLRLQATEPYAVKPEVFGSYVHLATMTNNLLQNAVNHAKSEVIINVTANSVKTGFSVSDDGPGIEEAQRHRVVQPFQRGSENTRAGYGLGLAVVSRIAAHHGAQLEISESTALGGAKFSVEFVSGDNQ